YNPEYPGTKAHLASIDVAAKKFGIAVRPVEFLSGSAIENALAEILRDRPDGVLSISDPLTETFRDQITAFGTSNKIPMAGKVSGNVQIGQLFSYGASLY